MSRTRPAARALSCLAAAAAFCAVPAAASVSAPVVSASGAGHALMVASDGGVSVSFTGRHGAFAKQLYLVREGADDVLVFDGASAVAGDTVDLGDFAGGEALVFRLAVSTAWGQRFDLYSGDGALNPRGFANARAMSMGDAVALVSFEDMIGGGDMSFNDFGFELTNVAAGAIPNPLPGAAIFMLTALGGGAAWRFKRG